MICLHCDKLDLRANRDMALLGLGKCKANNEFGKYMSIAFQRQCNGFSFAEKEIILQRDQWEIKRREQKIARRE